MRRTFHKVICTAPGVTVFKAGLESCRCRQNVVTEMPLGVWIANWRRHNDKLKVVSDACETDSIYNETVEEPEPVVADIPITGHEPEPVHHDTPELAPKRSYIKKGK